MKKTMLISGGSDGLGKEIAAKYTGDYRVVILAANEEKLRSVAKEIGCEYIKCDVTRADDIETAIRQIGKVDVLINNAGIWIEGELTGNESEKIKHVLEVNTLGTILLTKEVLKVMEKGLIINIISQGGINAKAERSVYYASKWAITGFTKCLQLELAKRGIRVMGFYPGAMNTNLYAKAGFKNRDASVCLPMEEVLKGIDLLLTTKVEIPQLEMMPI